jgi:hypothetical protein
MALQKRRWQVHSAVTRKVRLQKQPKAIGQKGIKKWTAAVDLQPTTFKSDRPLGCG